MFVLFLAGLFLEAGSIWGQDSADSAHVNFYVEPILQKGLGGTSYDLSATGGVLSRLEFPQWSLEAGAVLGVSMTRGEERQWFVEASAAHSTLNFGGNMNDYDWEVFFPGNPQVPIGYTYSQDTTTSWHAGVEGAWTFYYEKPFSLALYGSYRYQSLFHVEYGAT
ncbi:MAG TPA: hypothetical protein VL126_02500, partial [Bacteroidota bacterium]|nr:hypothetical protein [Bacteroidota bacterium]